VAPIHRATAPFERVGADTAEAIKAASQAGKWALVEKLEARLQNGGCLYCLRCQVDAAEREGYGLTRHAKPASRTAFANSAGAAFASS
jgi:hypothetical protein